MDTDPTIRSFLKGFALAAGTAIFIALLFSTNAGATQPQCTGDRHYDSEANGCCPNVEQPECPGECEVCEPVLPCPDAPACPPVTCTATCEDGKDGTDGASAPPVIVQVDRCPAPEVLEVCKVRGNGVVVCSRAKRKGEGRTGARKIFVPRSIIDQIADHQRNY